MWLFRRPPVLGSTPTVRDGAPPDLDTQERVVINQVRAAQQWDSTYQDLTVNALSARVEESRRFVQEMIALGVLVVVLMIAGLIYSARVRQHDANLAAASAAAARTPYVPEAVRTMSAPPPGPVGIRS